VHETGGSDIRDDVEVHFFYELYGDMYRGLGVIPKSVREPGMALVHGSHNMTEVPKKRAVCIIVRLHSP
jgi:hypothetical protein